MKKIFEKLFSKNVFVVFDGGGHGMMDMGLLGVYETEKAAKEAMGSNWFYIKKIKINTFYEKGIR